MDEIKAAIIEAVKSYTTFSEEEYDEAFISLLVDTLIEEYKGQRHYPADYTDEMIEADTEAYFKLKKTYVATQIIPAILGKVGGEGLSALTDNGTTKTWLSSIWLRDVTPICEVV